MPRTFEDRYTWKIGQKTSKTLHKQQMLSEGDNVLIALSGGKDSLALTELLAARRKHLPFAITLAAVHVRNISAGYQVNERWLREFCTSLSIPLVFKDITTDFSLQPNKKPCFICSWERRKAIFELTRDEGYNKLAFGHHRDDAVETLLMNMVYHGSVSSLPYTLSMFNGRVTVIRPLLDLKETELAEYARCRQFPSQIRQCPHEDKTSRNKMREVMTHFEALNPNAGINLFKAMGNIYREYLPGKNG